MNNEVNIRFFVFLFFCFYSIKIRCEELQLIDRCHPIEPRPGTVAEILLKHTQEQYDILKATEHETNEQKLEKLSSHYDAIYIHPVSFQLLFIFRLNLFECHCSNPILILL